MVAEERTLRGSYIGSAVPARDIPRYVALYQRGKLPVDKLMGERLTLEDINRGFDRLATGQEIQAPRTWQLANASINRLLWTPQGLTLVGWADTQHLDTGSRDETVT